MDSRYRYMDSEQIYQMELRRMENIRALDNYIENVLEGFEWMESGDSFLKVKAGEFERTFKITEDTTVESLRSEIRKALELKVKFYQNILDKVYERR